MKLTNISSKVVSIGNETVMPDETISITDVTPGIKALEKVGVIKLSKAEEKKAKDSKKAVEGKNEVKVPDGDALADTKTPEK